MTDTPNVGGRPTDYRKEFDEQAYKLCLLGATDDQLADFFKVSKQTINVWKHKHSSFIDSLNRGKDMADAEVASSLYNRARGYEAPDTKFATHEGMITDCKEYIRHYPPDPTSCIFWLKNRQRGKWRDKQEHEHSGDKKIEISYPDPRGDDE